MVIGPFNRAHFNPNHFATGHIASGEGKLAGYREETTIPTLKPVINVLIDAEITNSISKPFVSDILIKQSILLPFISNIDLLNPVAKRAFLEGMLVRDVILDATLEKNIVPLESTALMRLIEMLNKGYTF